MCILFVYREPEADENAYRLIIASNRDEIYKRPATPAHYWENHADCIGGTDNQPGKEGGSWFGVSKTGRAGVILNLSRAKSDERKGRGNLTVDYVTSLDSAENYLHKLHEKNVKSQLYNPFNLILLNLWDASIYYLSSSPDSRGPQLWRESVLGVGNSLIEQPYIKVQNGKEEFKKIVSGAKTSERDKVIQDLRQFLKWEKRHLPDPELLKRSPQMYEELSSIFVRAEDRGCGTRTHTIMLVDGANNITFYEETREPNGTWKTQLFETALKGIS